MGGRAMSDWTTETTEIYELAEEEAIDLLKGSILHLESGKRVHVRNAHVRIEDLEWEEVGK
jgi:hypothetical protein